MAATDALDPNFISAPVILRISGPSDEIKVRIEQFEETREYLRDKGTANFPAGEVVLGTDDALTLLGEIYELAVKAERELAEHKRLPRYGELGVLEPDPYRWNPETGNAESVPGEKGGAPRNYWARMISLFWGAEQARLGEKTGDTRWNSLELRERIAARLRPLGPPEEFLDTSRGEHLDQTIKNHCKRHRGEG